MADGAEERPVAARFAMHPAVVALLGAVTAGLAAAAVIDHGPGRAMFAVAAAVAGLECARGALVRPTLEVTAAGVRLAHGLGRRELLRWDQLEGAEMRRRSRRGGNAKWLELDTGDRLLTVPAYRLGGAVSDVRAAIESARPGHNDASPA